MLFDGVCNFCSGSVLYSLPRLKADTVRFCPMQSSTGQATLRKYGFPLDNFETFIFLSKGQVFVKSEGWVQLSQHLKQPWPTLGILLGVIPLPIRDWAYSLVARNRYKIMGRRDACIVPGPKVRKLFIL